ncbi:DUF3103 family protein [Shewanella psychropiezotolerans]|uniref:DUF3103 family protein n=1 Tax=Shewanella psychropiezotolerans TaxID=2593655 RepID=A0ABX5WW68_9GAMM|nr:DUF3103 family protein [Shewanella psychropiezotolerans]QDO82637.1 DUF3103 family protein [Shewanella psychropiezotolerans]
MKKMTLTLLMITVPLASIISPCSSAEPVERTDISIQQASQYSVSVSHAKREIALELSRQYTRVLPVLQSNINQYNLAMDADLVFRSSGSDTKTLRQSELAIREAKGLYTHTKPKINTVRSGSQAPSLVQFRLADASMLSDWQQGESPLFAFEPDGDDKQWANIEAYDVEGNIHLLDVYQLPQRPVIVIGLDKQQAMREGLAVMRDTLALSTHSASQIKRAKHQVSAFTAADQLISTTVIKQISVKDDEEPWISGKAEIYGIVTGVNPSRDEPVLDIIEMPYLDYSGTEYYPNQIVIHWERYRWAAADLVLMEHDDGTNYKDLATALVSIAERVLQQYPDPEVQGYAIIATITNEILNALPDAWFTNNDDFVDVYYTLQEGETYTNHYGAGGNARAFFAPLVIQSR